jgi:hypothetical protein
LSSEAAKAATPGDIFKLFFTPQMVDLIVLHTNK